MTVDEFLTELYGDELSDLFVGNRNDKEESRGKILPLMNSGMTYAYALYKIKFDTTQLLVTNDVYDYTLPGTDIQSISRVINSYGRELESWEVQVLGQTLHFPNPDNVELQVEYKVKPVKFTTAQNDTTVVLELPDLLICWLKPYVASRYLAGMKTEAAIAKAADFSIQANTAETTFQNTNTTNEFSPQNGTRLCSRGFA